MNRAGLHVRARAAQRGEQRLLWRLGLAAGAFDGDGERQAALAPGLDAADELDVALVVDPTPARRPGGVREAVPALPHAKGALGDAGPLDHVADGQGPHDSRSITSPISQSSAGHRPT